MNEHTGFELALSDYEKGYLAAYFDCAVLPDFRDGVEQEWYGVGIGEAMFDLNVWIDEETSQIVCVVHRCVEKDGEWNTDVSTSWFLREVSND